MFLHAGALRRPARWWLALCMPALLVASPALADSDSVPDPAALQLASVHAVVADLDTGHLLYSKDAERAVSIASITKLMTAMVVLDAGQPLKQWLSLVEKKRVGAKPIVSRMKVGARLQRENLLRVTLMSSDNRAAWSLASHYPGGITVFVAAMNAKARELGMHNSLFVEPSGLDPANRASASDLFKMLKAAAGYDLIRKYTTTSRYTAHFRSPSYWEGYGNTNLLVVKPDWDVRLSKTGFLREAGRCLMVEVNIDGRDIAVVLLNAFGILSPVGDVGRVKQWLATGKSDAVAPAARRYEKRMASAYHQTDLIQAEVEARTRAKALSPALTPTENPSEAAVLYSENQVLQQDWDQRYVNSR